MTTPDTTIEDLEFGLINSLALLSASADAIKIAGFAATHQGIGRRDRLTALREVMIALREMDHRLPLLEMELRGLIRHLDPQSEMLEGPA
jgi:hypothetical protein